MTQNEKPDKNDTKDKQEKDIQAAIQALTTHHYIRIAEKNFGDYKKDEIIIAKKYPNDINKEWQSWIKSGCVKPLSQQEIYENWKQINQKIKQITTPKEKKPQTIEEQLQKKLQENRWKCPTKSAQKTKTPISWKNYWKKNKAYSGGSWTDTKTS